MSNTLYLECLSGISGDMTVAALLDLGADRQVLEKALDSLPVDGFSIEIKRGWMSVTLMLCWIRRMRIMIMIWSICMGRKRLRIRDWNTAMRMGMGRRGIFIVMTMGKRDILTIMSMGKRNILTIMTMGQRSIPMSM